MYEKTFPNKRFKHTLEFLQKHVNTSETILNDDSFEHINGLIKNISNIGIQDDLFAKNYRKYNKCKKVSLL